MRSPPLLDAVSRIVAPRERRGGSRRRGFSSRSLGSCRSASASPVRAGEIPGDFRDRERQRDRQTEEGGERKKERERGGGERHSLRALGSVSTIGKSAGACARARARVVSEQTLNDVGIYSGGGLDRPDLDSRNHLARSRRRRRPAFIGPRRSSELPIGGGRPCSPPPRSTVVCYRRSDVVSPPRT